MDTETVMNTEKLKQEGWDLFVRANQLQEELRRINQRVNEIQQQIVRGQKDGELPKEPV